MQIEKIDEIYTILDSAIYGTLALSKGVEPYSVPINFARINNTIYFHSSKKGRKMDILKVNKNVSFSVVDEGSIIPSYFSDTNNMACLATQFFRSVIIEGLASIVTTKDEKTKAIEALMQKFQSEGKYKPLTSSLYNSRIDATQIVKITPYHMSLKVKFGQNLNIKRFDMIIKNLKKRATKQDLKTLNLMRRYYGV